MFDQVERAIGSRLEAGVERGEFQDLVALAVKARAQLTDKTDQLASWVLHQLHMPSHRDIRDLNEQMNRVERRVRDIDARLTRSRRPVRRTPRQP